MTTENTERESSLEKRSVRWERLYSLATVTLHGGRTTKRHRYWTLIELPANDRQVKWTANISLPASLYCLSLEVVLILLSLCFIAFYLLHPFQQHPSRKKSGDVQQGLSSCFESVVVGYSTSMATSPTPKTPSNMIQDNKSCPQQ